MISTQGLQAVAREMQRRGEDMDIRVLNDDAWGVRVRTKDGCGFAHIGSDEVLLLTGDPQALVSLIADRIECARSQIRPWARWPFSVRIGRRRRHA